MVRSVWHQDISQPCSEHLCSVSSNMVLMALRPWLLSSFLGRHPVHIVVKHRVICIFISRFVLYLLAHQSHISDTFLWCVLVVFETTFLVKNHRVILLLMVKLSWNDVRNITCKTVTKLLLEERYRAHSLTRLGGNLSCVSLALMINRTGKSSNSTKKSSTKSYRLGGNLS